MKNSQTILAKYCKSKFQSRKSLFVFAFLCVVFSVAITGCNSNSIPASEKRDAANSKDYISDVLNSKFKLVIPLQVYGDGIVEYLDRDNTPKKEQLSRVDIVLYPQERMYFTSSHILKSKAFRFGLTDDEFWCWARFSKVDDYYWADKKQLTSNCAIPMGFSPDMIYESLGFVDLEGANTNLSISPSKRYEVVSVLSNSKERVLRKYFIDIEKSQIVKIVYLDKMQKPYLISEMGDFRIFKNYAHRSLPRKIKIIVKNAQMSFFIRVKDARRPTFSKSKLQKLFSRPKPDKNTKVYRLDDDCNFESMN